MDYWLEAEIRAHRHRLLAQAEVRRRVRLARRGRSRALRTYIANGVQRLSDGLAHAASAIRDGEQAERRSGRGRWGGERD